MPCLCCTHPAAAKTCSRVFDKRCVIVVCSCDACSYCCTAAADLTCSCWQLELPATPLLKQTASGRCSCIEWCPVSSMAAADPSCTGCHAGHAGALKPALHRQRASWLAHLAALRAPHPPSLRGRWLQPATAEGAGRAAAPAPRHPTGPAARLGLRSSTCPLRQPGRPTARAGELRRTRQLQHCQAVCRLHRSSLLPWGLLQTCCGISLMPSADCLHQGCRIQGLLHPYWGTTLMPCIACMLQDCRCRGCCLLGAASS